MIIASADAAEKSRSEHDPGGSGQTRRSACYAKDDQARDQDCFAAPAIATAPSGNSNAAIVMV